MATPTLANSPTPYAGTLISDLVQVADQPIARSQPAVLYTLKYGADCYWMWKLEINGFAPRFYNTRYEAEKLVARYQKVLAAREARSHEETT